MACAAQDKVPQTDASGIIHSSKIVLGRKMLILTTPNINGKQLDYKGFVSGRAIMGANVFRDVFASIRDIVGGRSASYEKELKRAQDIALEEMIEDARRLGADAIISVDLDYETVGQSMLLVSASGTAVKIVE